MVARSSLGAGEDRSLGCSEREICPVARNCLAVHVVGDSGAHQVGWMPRSPQRELDCLDDCRLGDAVMLVEFLAAASLPKLIHS